MRKVLLAICIGVLSNCGGGGSDASYQIWAGKLAFERSSCDIVVSQPPATDPNDVVSFLVGPIERQLNTQVEVIDEAGQSFSGLVEASGDFDAFHEGGGSPTVPNTVRFEFVDAQNAVVSESFVFNAPHGCTHYFRGEFERVSAE